MAVKEVDDVAPIRRRYGMPDSVESCHTAVVGGYAVEGHVPADLILRLLSERPDVVGIAVPGMPPSAPGMNEGVAGESYDVVLVDRRGGTSLYARRM